MYDNCLYTLFEKKTHTKKNITIIMVPIRPCWIKRMVANILRYNASNRAQRSGFNTNKSSSECSGQTWPNHELSGGGGVKAAKRKGGQKATATATTTAKEFLAVRHHPTTKKSKKLEKPQRQKPETKTNDAASIYHAVL